MTLHSRFEFVPMGTVMEARAGAVAVDVGGKCIPGVIDHHFREAGDECAASLLARSPGLVLDHLGTGGVPFTVIMHSEPDLDCVVSAFLALHLAREGRLPAGAEVLAEYTRRVDRGQSTGGEDTQQRSLWGLYTAATHLLRARPGLGLPGDQERFTSWVQRGFELVELCLRGDCADVADIAVAADARGVDEEWAFLSEDQGRYRRDRARAREVALELPGPSGDRRSVPGLVISAPEAVLFKQFARLEGFTFTHVLYPDAVARARRAGWPATRHVISVAPENDVWLKGLGAVLEAEEIEARAGKGFVRGGEPRWPDVTCADPWYDGRSPLHGFTIVDTPHGGTLLSDDRVVEIVGDTDRWIVVGEAVERLLCPCCGLIADPSARFCPADGEMLTPAIVAGCYEVLRKLGAGGMGSVLEVRDRRTQDRYALKLMRRDRRMGGGAARRFFKEALLANSLDHPHLMRVVDVGADATSGLYMVCEVLDGRTLAEELERWSVRGERLPLARVMTILQQICGALGAMHRLGVIHRDLKPANVMVLDAPGSEELTVKIMDFGLALEADADATRLTASGVAVGTPLYAPPEQLSGEGEITVRSDIYALGAILYEMLGGVAPFADCSSLMELLTRKLTSSPKPLARDGSHDIDFERFDALVSSMMSVEPADRPASVDAVLLAVERAGLSPAGPPPAP